jgi:nitroimidazol reductase NimA-like FMN-containing flavoprotein (pyridoxamine 5'-phosphate oxidase superfamily)
MTERTRIRRLPKKAVDDRAVLYSILDSALVAHIAVVDGGQPYALPVGCARDGDRLLLHGSSASRLFRILCAGAPCCASITLLDGLVMARSSFESSMHYRSVMILGHSVELTGHDKVRALDVLTEHFLPGRLTEIRKSTTKELQATSVVALELNEFSIKVSAGEPDDLPEDLESPIWAGVIPLTHKWGRPRPAADLRPGILPPPYLANWPSGRA